MAGGAPRRLTRANRVRKLIPTWSRDGRQIAYVTWDDDKAGADQGRRRAAAATGRIVTPEPGHYLEPASPPTGGRSPIARRRDGYLTTPLWGRDPGLYVVACARRDAQALSPRPARSRNSARQRPHLLRRADGEEEKHLFKSVSLAGDRRGHPSDQRTNAADFAGVARRAIVAWTERYQAYVMPFVRSGRSIDVAPDGKALPQSRVSADAGDWICTGPATAASFTGRRGPTSARRRSPVAGDSAAARQAKAPAAPTSASPSPAPQPSGRYRADRRAHRHHARRDEVIENGMIVINGDRIDASAGGLRSRCPRARAPSTSAARPSSPA